MLNFPDSHRSQFESPQPIHAEPPNASDAQAGLDDLPNELLDKIAGYLPMRSLQALACMNRRMGDVVNREREKIELSKETLPGNIQRFSKGSSPDTLPRLLSSIRRLRPDDQVKALHAVCARLDQLPEAERKLAAAAGLSNPSGLPERLLDRLKILANHGSAANAVIAGEPVNAVARCFDSPNISALERLAIDLGPIQAAIDAGGERAMVARRYGVPDYRLPLRSSSPYVGYLSGVQEPSFYMSRLIEARRAVRQGEHVDTAVGRCFEGLEFRTRHRDDLVMCAVDGAAGEAAIAGERVDDLVLRHGIDTQEGRWELERRACNGAAGERAQAGDNVAAVALEHGIQSAPYRLALMGEAMKGLPGDPVRAGDKTVEQVAQEHGVDLAAIDSDMGLMPTRHLPVDYRDLVFKVRKVTLADFLAHQAASAKLVWPMRA